jgi:hypothetical protein
MKKLTVKLLLIFAIFSVYSCKNQELTPVNNVNITPGSTTGNSTGSGVPFDPSTQTLVSQGTFKDGGHPTSGTAKLYKKAPPTLWSLKPLNQTKAPTYAFISPQIPAPRTSSN